MLDGHLDIFGQQPVLSDLYTQICFCFSVLDDSTHSVIIDKLKDGLERLALAFPWVAGQVTRDNEADKYTGSFKIIELEKTPRLLVKDLRNDTSLPSLHNLRQSRYPIGMLDENIVAPRNTLPGGTDDPVSPVLLVQATFIEGGLLLTFVAQHNVMDMTGQGHIIRMFEKACHNRPFTAEEISFGNVERRNIIPLLDESYQPGPELEHQRIQIATSHNVSDTAGASSSWAYFTFSASALEALKSAASHAVTTDFISTDDALCAFIWQSIVRARLHRLDPIMDVTFARAIDPRRFLGIPLTYAGVVQNMTYHKRTVQKLIDTPLGEIASELRSAIDPKTSTLSFQTRAFATALHLSPTKDDLSVAAKLDLSTDIMLSSWAKENFHSLDFNLGLGRPEAVRRPRFTPVESLLYLMPKAWDGEIAAALCLRDDDMDRLRTDEEFRKHARYVG